MPPPPLSLPLDLPIPIPLSLLPSLPLVLTSPVPINILSLIFPYIFQYIFSFDITHFHCLCLCLLFSSPVGLVSGGGGPDQWRRCQNAVVHGIMGYIHDLQIIFLVTLHDIWFFDVTTNIGCGGCMVTWVVGDQA